MNRRFCGAAAHERFVATLEKSRERLQSLNSKILGKVGGDEKRAEKSRPFFAFLRRLTS